jgi:hypothetical protein
VKYIGEGAFAGNKALSSVTFGSDITEIGAYAFADCTSLANIQLPEQIVYVGDYAFYNTMLDNAELVNVDKIGAYAFAGTKIDTATLKTGVEIGDGAFANCAKLKTVNNLENAKAIGAKAFSGTALEEVTLTNVISIGDFAFAESKVTKVTFGDKLTQLGENPFANCAIETFGKQVNVEFGKENETIGSRLEETYDVSETVKVIDGVLYQKVATGLELISYPMAKTANTYVVVEGTARIAARAFAGAALESVTLASTLKSLGDKAFYGCEKLGVVIFKSYDAPLLEEEYDTSYLTYTNLPFTGKMGEYEGLGISKFYMWNITSSYNNFYYGANFVDRIGHIDNKIVMVKPANGQNYNTFIFSQYFGTTVTGNNAAMDGTLKVIAMIEALPEMTMITLADEAAIVAARAAFEQIPSLEQRALVTNLSKLESAEDMLIYLKPSPDTPDDDSSDSSGDLDSDSSGDSVVTDSSEEGGCKSALTPMAVGIALLAVCAATDKLLLSKNKKKESVSEEVK